MPCESLIATVGFNLFALKIIVLEFGNEQVLAMNRILLFNRY
jgi:hypothetical protein